MMQYVVLAIYVLCSVSGLVCFKLGSMDELSLAVTRSSFSLHISWLSVLGLALYICSFLIYMGLVAKNDLSYLMPVVTGAVYILTLVSSVTVFKETMHVTQVIGSVLILAGVVLMNIKAK